MFYRFQIYNTHTHTHTYVDLPNFIHNCWPIANGQREIRGESAVELARHG